MKIFITISHPAHIHFYKNFIWQMQKKGHIIKIAAVKKDVSLNLLNAYGFKYDLVSVQNNRGIRRIQDQFIYECNIYGKVKNFSPDIITGIGGTAAAHISKLTNAKSIIFTDNFLHYDKFITHPWADVIITPSSFSHNLGKKQIKIQSFKELAYLHPDVFSPNSNIFDLMNLKKTDRFVIIRFVSFKSAHDVNISGFDVKSKIRLIDAVKKYARVFISSEGELPPELNKYIIRFPSEKIHDALYFADLVITDSQTMTTEAAVLGTPAVRCNDWVGSKNEMLNFIELENKYGLIHNFTDPELAINKCCELLSINDNKKQYRERRKNLLSDKINMTKFLVWFVENYDEKHKDDMQNYYTSYISNHY